MTRRWLLTVAAALTLAACAGKEVYVDFEPEWKATGARPDIAFTASLQPGAESLAIRYTVQNNGTEPVVVYSGVPGEAASHSFDVYVTAREDGVVEIAKRTFAIPPNTRADSVGQIEGVVVEPGKEFSEDFRIPLPLKGRRPYVGQVKLPDPVRRVVFCVGAVRQSEAPQPKPAESGRGAYPANGPQHLFCSPVTELG